MNTIPIARLSSLAVGLTVGASLSMAQIVTESPETFGITCISIKGHDGVGPATLTYFGLSFVGDKKLGGTLTQVVDDTVTDAGANFPAIAGDESYLLITSGPRAGSRFTITANTSTTLTLAEDLSAFALGDLVNQAYEIRDFTTLDDLFGTSVSGIPIAAGPNLTDADNVTLLRNGGVTRTFFFDNNAGQEGWKDASANPAGDFRLAPEEGIVIERKISGDVAFYPQGVVLFSPTVVNVPAGFSLMSTVKANQALTLGQSGLHTGDPATGVAEGPNPSEADNVLLIDPVTGVARRCFYRSGFGWRTSTLQDATNTAIPAGTAIFILRRASSGGAFQWTIPAETE